MNAKKHDARLDKEFVQELRRRINHQSDEQIYEYIEQYFATVFVSDEALKDWILNIWHPETAKKLEGK